VSSVTSRLQRVGLAVLLVVSGAGGGYVAGRIDASAASDGGAAAAGRPLVTSPAVPSASASGATAPDPTGPPTAPPPGSPTAAPAVPAGDAAGPATPVAAGAPEPVADAVSATINSAYDGRALGARPVGIVLDAASGDVLYDRSASARVIPASTAKLATAIAALTVLGPQARLTTRVVAGSASGQIVLVGGGDPTLASGVPPVGETAAGLPALARSTATALRAAGTSVVTLSYDASLFSGPATAPGWKPVYVTEGDVAPVGALSVDGGRVRPAAPARSPDPALAAATRFRALLASDGITVTGVLPPRPAGSGRQLAAVRSAPVADLVERMLTNSDNDIAEALARHVALAAHRPGTFAAGASAVVAAVSALGVGGVSLVDGSGLSRQDGATPAALAALLRLAASPDHPELRPVLTGLPIAGFSGTMRRRFRDPATLAFDGVVRAKTGTLKDVNAMAGTVVDADGRLLVFAFVSNRTKPVTGHRSPEQGLDALIAAVAACGCR
jgi:D-alanyl-D-alanine carboxypeptidase/D-alanyl-D-alanine-endopeptidase (penicillin-binding protein 4)